MTHLDDADENFNSSSSNHLRLRKSNNNCEQESDIGSHKTGTSSTPQPPKTSEDDSTIEADISTNTAIFQHIAVAKVHNQAQVLYIITKITIVLQTNFPLTILKELKNQLISQMDTQLTAMLEEFITKVESVKVPQKYKSFIGGFPETTSRKKKTPCGSLPEKEFEARNSLLTDLFEVSHIQTIYHIFIAILILLFMNTMIEDVIDKGQISFDFELIQWAFGNLQTVFFTWVSLI